MLVPGPMMQGWYLYDVDTGARTDVKGAPDGIPLRYQALPHEGRVLVMMQQQASTAAVIIQNDGTAFVAVEDIGKGQATLVEGNALVYSLGKNRIFGKVDKDASRELVTVDGELKSIAGNGKLGYAALSSTGELVRGTFSGASFARTHVTDVARGAFIVGDNLGTVFVATGNRLLVWRGSDLRETSRFAATIDFMAATEVGLYVVLESKDVFFIAASGNQTPQRVPLSSLSDLTPDGKVALGISASRQVELADMPLLASWSLPRLFPSATQTVISPDGLRVVQGLGLQVGIWKIDPPASDFAAWLAELTNATEDEGHVRWPWQP
jgi:hypothetical protein